MADIVGELSGGEERGGSTFRLDEALAAPTERRIRDLPRLITEAFGLVWHAARREFIISTLLQLVSSAGLAAQLLVTRSLLGHILRAHHGYSATIPDLAATGVIIAIVGMAGAARTEIQQTLGELVARYAMGRVLEVSTAVELLAYDMPAFHDRQQRAVVNASYRPLQMTNGLIGFMGAAFSAFGIGVALLEIQPLFCLVVLASIVPLALASTTASRALYRYAVDQTERDRRRMYLQVVLSMKDHAKEVRAYNAGGFLSDRWSDLYDQRIFALRALVRKRIRQGVAGAAVTGALTAGALGLIILFVSDGRLSLAGAGVAAGAIILLSSQLQSLAWSAGSLYESSLFIRDFTNFVALAPRLAAQHGTAPAPKRVSLIEARNVSFTYPSRTAPALRDVSLELPAGQVIALVGENGSGKTTLAKILAGLYPPSSGGVYWDGVDIASIAPDQLRSKIAVLFQDFVKYQLSASENIGFGNERLIDDEAAISAAARAAGAHRFLEDLPNGYSTTLGPEFLGGVDLSGGQWQRVALARAFLRDAELIILDEPTAALDARAEAELFSAVRELFAGRTIVLISHRFASVRLADHIYVLERGRITEQGDHDALMAAAGTYAQLFTLQAQAYSLDEPVTPGVSD